MHLLKRKRCSKVFKLNSLIYLFGALGRKTNMPIGTLIFGIFYDIIPAQYILFVSGSILVLIVLTLLRRSVIEIAYLDSKNNKSNN